MCTVRLECSSSAAPDQTLGELGVAALETSRWLLNGGFFGYSRNRAVRDLE